MTIKNGLFTSEAVSEGHPDKICDQISDAILDACLAQDPHARVAVETAIKGNLICLLGEITTTAQIEPATIVRQVLGDLGHADGAWGLQPDRIRVIEALTRQAPEIAFGVDGDDLGAGDQGLSFGYATSETESLIPLPWALARALIDRLQSLRVGGLSGVLGPDAKAQATVRYAAGQPVGVSAVVLSCQHAPTLAVDDLRDLLRGEVLVPVLGDLLTPETVIHLNPAGSFHMGGPIADAGLSGRKIIVDAYGGMARHGGGAFSGKDATKVDRSAAYAARQIAREVVARGWAEVCELRLAYAIGQARPVAIDFETFGTEIGRRPTERYAALGIDLADAFRPSALITRLDLRRPVFRDTAARGHFGRPNLAWEAPFLTLDRDPVTAERTPSNQSH